MTYGELLHRVWGPEYQSDIQLLRTWVSRIRSKLEKDPRNSLVIQTVPKAGYIIKLPQVTL
jgi:two-component system KDP operon response regulator KdpE